MHIGFHIRPDGDVWGGDIGALEQIVRGLAALGHQGTLTTRVEEAGKYDFFFLTNTCFDLRTPAETLQLLQIPYGVIGFHEDFIGYQTLSSGLFVCVVHCLNESLEFPGGLDHLLEVPDVVRYFGLAPRKLPLSNASVLKEAVVSIASSASEAAVMMRDSPHCKARIVPLASAVPDSFDKSFLQFTGLSSKSYILQVGRLERRKNQLATILATRNSDVPLVFIATKGYEPNYEKACAAAAAKWRKAPTIFLTQASIPAEGNVSVIPLQEKLPKDLLMSAFGHAGLHIHPAFLELPGLTLLEAAALGVPTITSDGCAIRDYIDTLDGRIHYTQPHHIRKIEAAVDSMFGQPFSSSYRHPAFARKESDVAADLLGVL